MVARSLRAALRLSLLWPIISLSLPTEPSISSLAGKSATVAASRNLTRALTTSSLGLLASIITPTRCSQKRPVSERSLASTEASIRGQLDSLTFLQRKMSWVSWSHLVLEGQTPVGVLLSLVA